MTPTSPLPEGTGLVSLTDVQALLQVIISHHYHSVQSDWMGFNLDSPCLSYAHVSAKDGDSHVQQYAGAMLWM